MLYLIGGAARTGKTTLSVRIAKEKGIPCISTDVLRNALWNAYPELGIKEFSGDKEKIAEKLFPYFLRIFKNVYDKYPDYLIEGETFFPSQIAKIEKDRLNIKCVFLGFSHTNLETLKNTSEYNDWISKMPVEDQEGVPQHLIDLSTKMKEECEQFGFKYIDTWPDFNKAQEEVFEYLFS